MLSGQLLNQDLVWEATIYKLSRLVLCAYLHLLVKCYRAEKLIFSKKR